MLRAQQKQVVLPASLPKRQNEYDDMIVCLQISSDFFGVICVFYVYTRHTPHMPKHTCNSWVHVCFSRLWLTFVS